MKEGWNRLNLAQRLIVVFWGPGMVSACVLGALYFGVNGNWLMMAVTIVIVALAVIALWQLVVSGGRDWPRPR